MPVDAIRARFQRAVLEPLIETWPGPKLRVLHLSCGRSSRRCAAVLAQKASGSFNEARNISRYHPASTMARFAPRRHLEPSPSWHSPYRQLRRTGCLLLSLSAAPGGSKQAFLPDFGRSIGAMPGPRNSQSEMKAREKPVHERDTSLGAAFHALRRHLEILLRARLEASGAISEICEIATATARVRRGSTHEPT